ncbi:phosphatidylglycerophosphatase A family protein [Jannaschia aquimarina]|uniref:Phosphatidylglycerophosphatase A n=1 Tax=Jannaschia aquimarina TaxID=935700 RepID=A0A0D1DE02_9RHOB|nr:phosphatidylglycerophosphatase A [Jannaschia aquimarina]KIT18188.1 Phosphatidylglycerophosphatase A [Jannaschia aquimarina]SNT40272.1 phosphatidylglycerophosphatase A [Jannaschia aquimarina]
MSARAIATLGGVGLLRPAPGTWGSLAALPLAWLVMQGGAIVFSLACLALVPLGLWAVAAATKGAVDHDPSEIVIDEVAGQWIALLPVAWGAAAAGVPVGALWPGWIAAFVLFRLFDVLKPGPVGWADRRADAVGVMLDDLVAGLLAAVGVLILAGMAHTL